MSLYEHEKGGAACPIFPKRGRRAVVLCDGPPPDPGVLEYWLTGADLFLCTDAAGHPYDDLPRPPDIVIGDFDSLAGRILAGRGGPTFLRVDEQETTDSEKALLYAAEQGCTEAVLVGAVGWRLDHTLYNCQLLERMHDRLRVCLASHMADGVRIGPGETVAWSLRPGVRFSLLPHGGRVPRRDRRGRALPAARRRRGPPRRRGDQQRGRLRPAPDLRRARARCWCSSTGRAPPPPTRIEMVLAAVYGLFLLYVIVRLLRRPARDQVDFLVAGRRLTLPVFVASLVSTWYGGLLGIGEYSWRHGVSNWLVFGVPYYLYAGVFAIVARRPRAPQPHAHHPGPARAHVRASRGPGRRRRAVRDDRARRLRPDARRAHATGHRLAAVAGRRPGHDDVHGLHLPRRHARDRRSRTRSSSC